MQMIALGLSLWPALWPALSQPLGCTPKVESTSVWAQQLPPFFTHNDSLSMHSSCKQKNKEIQKHPLTDLMTRFNPGLTKIAREPHTTVNTDNDRSCRCIPTKSSSKNPLQQQQALLQATAYWFLVIGGAVLCVSIPSILLFKNHVD
jgi:hypothetical protein